LVVPRKKRVLFVCTGNQARSQMAEALMRERAGEHFDVQSAGAAPKDIVHQLAVKALDEIGIDISGARPKHLEEFLSETFDFIITLCDNARDMCPVFPGQPASDHWNLTDPAAAEGSEEKQFAAFKAARDEIIARIDRFVEANTG
jgi:arsenate reductase